MLREKAITRYLNSLAGRIDVPFRVALWNGKSLTIGDQPRVTIRLPSRSAARFFLPPSIGNLARGYVTGRFDVE